MDLSGTLGVRIVTGFIEWSDFPDDEAGSVADYLDEVIDSSSDSGQDVRHEPQVIDYRRRIQWPW